MDPKSNKSTLNLKLDYRVITIVLLVVIAVMLAVWQPWMPKGERTIEVTGQSTVKAVPDEFLFMPNYDFTGTDKTALLASVSAKSNEVVAKLKELGVSDEKIKTNSTGYDFPLYSRDDSGEVTYSLSLTVTISDKDMAQKVQDYLVTTAPTGQVLPQATFSEAKRKELESTARDAATKDARAKADQSAKNLGFWVGGVKTVNDGAGFSGMPYPYALAEDSVRSSLAVMPGENDLSYSVTVTYYVW